MSLPLLGFLVFGYFLKENEKTPSLKEAAEEILAPVATIFVGVLIGSSIRAESFFQLQTLAYYGHWVVCLHHEYCSRHFGR